MGRILVVIMLFAGFSLLPAGLASAGPLLYIDDSLNRLGTVDVGTGAVTVIGSLGSELITDIAFSPTGDLFGISFRNLYRIDASTAASTFVGTLDQTDQNALVFGTDGTLYSAGIGGKLYTVSTTDGEQTLIGNIGFSSAGDLAFNRGGLFLSTTSNQLVRIDVHTGHGTLVGPLGFSNVFGLATGDDGVLYGVSGKSIFSVNTLTGAGTLVRTYEGGLGAAFGTSFFKEAVVTVPEPSSLALGSIAVLASLGYLLRAGRRIARDQY